MQRLRIILRLLAVELYLVAILPSGAVSQIVQDSLKDRATWRLGVTVGVGHNSPVTRLLGTTPHRDHLLISVSAATPILTAGVLRIYYDCQLLPIVLIRGNAPPDGFPPSSGGNQVPGNEFGYAFGFSPFGIEIQGSPSKALTIFAATAAGGLWFDKEYPIPGAGRIDFTLEFGAGMFIALERDHWLEVGYKYHHLSNANTAALNPGVDANLFYLGYQWAVSARR